MQECQLVWMACIRNKKISKMAAKMRAAEEEERKATEAKKLAETKQAEETLAVEEPKTEEKTPAEDFVNSIEQAFENRYENLDLVKNFKILYSVGVNFTSFPSTSTFLVSSFITNSPE